MAEDRRRDSRLDLRLARYFLAVVDHGGVTGATRALFLAQPSLSQAIRNLEEHLGTPIFHRAGGRMRLTTAGEEFAVAARVIALDVDRARAAVRAVQGLDAGSLEVATTTPWEMDPLPGLVAGLDGPSRFGRRDVETRRARVGDVADDQVVVTVVERGGDGLHRVEIVHPHRDSGVRREELADEPGVQLPLEVPHSPATRSTP
ncbi:LysR family transcriptional regulator [Pseudonocardia xishanensis]|uniref:HTH lysR-type domain-containing protein n=1 Tax=Pseudonocardia xishanensis TaxID=630995 RepID=A0ABP8RVR4_9PSEU